jgi:hypothetical protein
MKVLGISGGLVDGLIKSLRKGESLVESESYPAIFKCFKELHIELNMFPSMPMHFCFLGVEKSLIDQTKNIIFLTERNRPSESLETSNSTNA